MKTIFLQLIFDLLVWNGDRKRKLCVGLILVSSAPADSPHLSHLATYSSHSPLSPLSVWAHVCVCRLRMGPFPWFHSSAIRMFLSEKEFGNVFLKQTREGREKKRENGSASAFWGAQGSFYSMWGDFYTVDPEIPWVCVCKSTTIHNWASRQFPNSEGFIGVTLNEGKREIYGLDRQTKRKGRKKKSRREDWSEDRSLWSCWSFHNSPAITDINLWIMTAAN